MLRFTAFLVFLCISLQLEATEIVRLEDPGRNFSAAEVRQAYEEGKIKTLQDAVFNPGFTESVYWLLLESDKSNFDHRLIIGNPHINRIDFYVASQGQIKRHFLSGDWYPFRQRPIQNRLFAFPLTAPSGSLYIIRIDKHNESLQLSTSVLTSDEFYKQSANQNLINGMLWGVIMLILIFGAFLYITVKESLYLYYFLFILTASLWIIADKGYGFQYIWSDFPSFASRARPVFNAFLTVFLYQFMQTFIGQNKSSPYFKAIQLIKIASACLGFAFLFLPYSLHYLVLGFLLLLLILSASPLLLIPLSLAEKIKEGNRQAIFYLISTCVLMVFAFIELSVHGGADGIDYLSNYGIQTGLIAQVIVLTFGLAYRFNSYKSEKEHLLQEVNQRQGELTGRIIDTQEQERKKISDQLHDDIGSMLSLASLQISSVAAQNGSDNIISTKLDDAVELLAGISESVRTMSHSLTPLAIEKYGFENALLDLVKTINRVNQIQVEHIIIGMKDSGKYDTNFLNDLYRIIKELVNNVIKHSGAKHCFLQVIEYEDSISLMIEDDGKGFNFFENSSQMGIGLRNIQSKIDYFNGRIEVSSQSDKGTFVNIDLPVKPKNT